MGDNERRRAGVDPSADNLSGETLDRAFSDSFLWLRKVGLDPLVPRKLHRFSEGQLYCADSERLIFEVCLTERPSDGRSEFYRIGAEGLISFKRIANVSEVDSSILGRLHSGQGSVREIREERHASFVPINPMEKEDKQVMEERKRAAVKVVQRCRHGR